MRFSFNVSIFLALVILPQICFPQATLNIHTNDGMIHAFDISQIDSISFSVDNTTPVLVGHWPFNGNANDESGNGHDGTVFGATLTADRFGNGNSAYAFDGIDDYIEVASFAIIATRSSFTIAAWFKTSSSASQVIYGESEDKGVEDFVLLEKHGGGSVRLDLRFDDNSTFDLGASTTLEDGNWHHVAATRDGDNYKIYVDGREENSDNVSGTSFSIDHALIGSGWSESAPTDHMEGAIDDVRLYDRALSAEEIAALFNEGG